MLQLILGRSGTGKTTMMLNRAMDSARMGQQVVLLVPEQFSFETEKTVYSTLKGSDARRMDVLSFSRLAENIFRTYGGLARKRLTDMSRLVLMKIALKETTDVLQVYQKQSDKTSFVTTMLDTVEELKSSGTDAACLFKLSADTKDTPLGAKLQDIALIYEAYQAIVDRDYDDPLDDIAKAVALTKEGEYFAGKSIYIDGFDFFSPPERMLIENMMQQAWQLTVAFCADGLSQWGQTDIFLSQKQTARRLISYAKEHSIKVDAPVLLTDYLRTAVPALCAVEKLLRSDEPGPCIDSHGVRLIRCGQKYDEARYAAAQISTLIREKGMRFRDFAVVCRNMDNYELPIAAAFADYKIPAFYDKKQPVLTQPIAAVALASLEAVRGSYKTEAILKVARSPALGLEPQQVARLENYCYVWSIEGKAWLQEFHNDPSGISGADAESYRQELCKINALRQKLIEPLSELKKSLNGCDGQGFALGLYHYLDSIHALANLRSYFALQYPSDPDFARENDTLWNMIVDIMDLFCDTLAQVRYPVAAFVELFELALSKAELGHIPNTLDQVIVGSADRIRLHSPKVLFALGVNEGVFPAQYKPYGVFTDEERADLIRKGIELSSPCYEWTLLERFYLYRTLCAPKESLYVSCVVSDIKGEPCEPSAMMLQLQENFPGAVLEEKELGTDFFVANLETAMEQFARKYRIGGADSATLETVLKREGFSTFVEAVARGAANAPAQAITPQTAQSLLKGKIGVSPTKIENFYRCPYLFYCDNLLQLRPRKKVAYTPLESGSAIHYVLEMLLKETGSHGIAALSEEELKEKVKALLKQFIELMIPDTSQLASRFQYQFTRLVMVLCTILRHIGAEFEQSLFVAAGMEVPVGPGQEVVPAAIASEDGTPVELVGKIDRVDIYQQGDDRFVRVIDYKSGGKEFRLEDVMYGLNMQMLVYLFCLCDDPRRPFGRVRPAGILYMPGKVAAADTPPDAEEALIKGMVEDTLKMKGVLLDDERVLRAMERELEGRYIPVKTKKGSSTLTSASRVKSEAEFEAIRQNVYQNIKQMADSLTKGEVAPLPVRGTGINPCDYCDYGLLCNNKNGSAFKDITAKAEINQGEGGDKIG